jgi:cysteine-rich secretory family protein
MRFARVGLILCLAQAMASFSAQVSPTTQLQDVKPDKVQAEAWQIFLLTNKARADAGLALLRWDPALAAAAYKHCVRMTLEGQIAHRYGGESDMQQRAGESGAHFSLIEENLATGSEPVEIHEQWMDSPDNRAGLLNPAVDSVGVAVVDFHGMLYAVADFAHIVPVRTQAQIEAAVAGLLRSKGLFIAQDPADARGLCAGQGMVKVKPSFVMIWQNADLTQLPEGLTKVLAQTQFRKASVGNCPALDLDGNFNQYRIAALFYSTGVGVY